MRFMNSTVRDALEEGFTDTIRDALWGHIYLSPALAELTKSAPFSRLYRIFQLGPAYQVYPGATHTRAAHSIGVYHLSRRLLINLEARGAGSWLSVQGVRSFLCACLLHDLGHFPYTHSLKELPLRSHEALTGDIILREPVKSLVARAGGDPLFTAAIVDTALPAGEGRELPFYRKLLSGTLDPDKLDYHNRDARYSGVPYGAQDVDFIYSRLYPQEERGIDIDSRGIPSVESILFSKYLMYRTVYWHRSVRSATAMIKTAILGGLRDGTIAREELYDLDDPGLFSLMMDRSHPLFFLARRVRDGRLHAVAAEFPWDEAVHRGLGDIENRFRYEAALAEELSGALGCRILPGELIIDMPEPITFETGLHIIGDSPWGGGDSGIFSREITGSFVKALRIVRIFVDPAHEFRIKSPNDLYDILHKRKKWLQLI
jgi:hypothetical protein